MSHNYKDQIALLLADYGLDAREVFQDGISPTGYYSTYQVGDPLPDVIESGMILRTWHEWPPGFPFVEFFCLLLIGKSKGQL